MKKFCIYMLTILAFLNLTGCQSEQPHTAAESYTFTYQEVQIPINADAGPIIDALGEPKGYTEEPSCAFEGLDKTYYFGSFYLSTYPEGGNDYVYSLWFADDSVAAENGLRIGCTQQEAEAILGAGCFDGTNVFTSEKGESRLTVILTDGFVTSIQYQSTIG